MIDLHSNSLLAAIKGHQNAMSVLRGLSNLDPREWEGGTNINNLRHIASKGYDDSRFIDASDLKNGTSKDFLDLLCDLRNGELDYVSVGARGDMFIPFFFDTSSNLSINDRIDTLIFFYDKVQENLQLAWGSSKTREIYCQALPLYEGIDEYLEDAESYSIHDTISCLLQDNEPSDDPISLHLIPHDEIGMLAVKGVVLSKSGLQLLEYCISEKELPKNNLTVDAQSGTMQAPKQTEQNKENSTMKNSQSILSMLVANNKAAAVNAGEMEAGRLINQRIAAVFSGKVKLPFGASGMVNTPVGHVVLANLFATLIREYAPDNALAARAADGAVKSAAYELLRGVDIPAMLDEVLAGVALKSPDQDKIQL